MAGSPVHTYLGLCFKSERACLKRNCTKHWAASRIPRVDFIHFWERVWIVIIILHFSLRGLKEKGKDCSVLVTTDFAFPPLVDLKPAEKIHTHALDSMY